MHCELPLDTGQDWVYYENFKIKSPELLLLLLHVNIQQIDKAESDLDHVKVKMTVIREEGRCQPFQFHGR